MAITSSSRTTATPSRTLWSTTSPSRSRETESCWSRPGWGSPSTPTASACTPRAPPRIESMSSPGTRPRSRRSAISLFPSRRTTASWAASRSRPTASGSMSSTCWARSSTRSTSRPARWRRPIDLPAEPYTVLVSADSRTVYLSLWGGSKVLVFDAQDLSLKKEIEVGEHPNAMAFSKDGSRLFVACANTNAVWNIDLAQGYATEQISIAPFPGMPPGSTPNALDLSPDGKTLLVANADNNTVAVIEIEARWQGRGGGLHSYRLVSHGSPLLEGRVEDLHPLGKGPRVGGEPAWPAGRAQPGTRVHRRHALGVAHHPRHARSPPSSRSTPPPRSS